MKDKRISKDRLLQAYVIGLALGDGNLSNPNGRAVRLRITCDLKYPGLIDRIKNSLQTILPDNKVTIVKKKRNCVDISCYSNYWEKILGWSAVKGSKFSQSASVPDWIKNDREAVVSCLRGLIETDGAIYLDRGYKMVIFKSIIPQLAEAVHQMIGYLGFAAKLYRVEPKSPQKTAYHVRLSRDVLNFLNLVQPEKN